jgi:hypothetical protein
MHEGLIEKFMLGDPHQIRKRPYDEGGPSDPYARSGPKRGKGKGAPGGVDSGYVPTTEYRIPVDVNAFPPDVNIIVQLLGPRGKHQQRMKNDSDAIVTTSGKGVRGQHLGGDDPLTLVVRSKDPAIPLTQRQIAVVFETYEDILRHVREFGNSDNAGNHIASISRIPPGSVMEFIWNIYLLLSRPRPVDLKADDLFREYFDLFGHVCPIGSWLVIDPSSGGLVGALKRIPHVVELYQPRPDAPWSMRSANPPGLSFSQLRDVDDAYRIRLQQIAAGRIPLEDLANSGGISGMLFGADRVQACINILMAIMKLLSEKSSSTNPMDVGTLKSEFGELYRIKLDVFDLLNEKSLLFFLTKFKMIFNVFHDGISWKITVSQNFDVNDIENVVKSVILVQPIPRKIVKLVQYIQLPNKETEYQPLAAPTGTDSVAALVNLLQGLKKPTQQPVAPVPKESSVTAQIQQLLQKKKQEAPKPVAGAASGTALNELMAALQAAKNK